MHRLCSTVGVHYCYNVCVSEVYIIYFTGNTHTMHFLAPTKWQEVVIIITYIDLTHLRGVMNAVIGKMNSSVVLYILSVL